MTTTFDSMGYDSEAFARGIDPFLQILSAEQARQLVQYQGDNLLRKRIEELAAKSNEGTLSEDERAEYEGYVRANKFVAILQAQARRRFSNS